MRKVTTIRRSTEPGRLDLEGEINRTGPPLSFPPEAFAPEERSYQAASARRRVERVPRSLGFAF